jgi:hypothetical protein
MKKFISTFKEIFRNLRIAQYNRRNNVWVISEYEFNRLVDVSKHTIIINNL